MEAVIKDGKVNGKPIIRAGREEGPHVALVTVDDKCRIVIPKRVREKAGISERAVLVAWGFENIVVLKKAEVGVPPTMEEIRAALR